MNKLCPLIKKECLQEKCMWYDSIFEQCAIQMIADELGHIRMLKEDNADAD